MSEPLLRVTGLKKHFAIKGGLLSREVGRVHAVDGVSFAVNRGETLGLVGESGCGKSTTARCVLRLIEPSEGEIVFDGRDMRSLSGGDLRAMRRNMQIVFQDPFASLNPRMTVMLIPHAMGVVAETAQRVVVMYAGKVVEEADVDSLFENPRHPYTQGLIRSIPRIDLDSAHKTRLEAIGGTVPILINPAPGCRFAPRCRFAFALCSEQEPVLREVTPGHRMACHLGETQGMSA